MSDDLTILVLAGGRGERLKPITKSLPKPLVKIHKKENIVICIRSFNKI